MTARERRMYARDLERLIALHIMWDSEDYLAGLDCTGYETDPPSFSEFHARLEVLFIRGDDNQQIALQDGARIYVDLDAQVSDLQWCPTTSEGNPLESEGYPEYTSDCDEQNSDTFGLGTGQFRGPPTMRAQRALRELEIHGECWGTYERQLAIAAWRHRQFPCRCAPRDGCHHRFPSFYGAGFYGPDAPWRPPLRLVSNRAPQARPIFRPY